MDAGFLALAIAARRMAHPVLTRTAEAVMTSDDEKWEAFLDPRFTVLELNSHRGRYQIQYLDVVTGWRGTLLRSGFERLPRRSTE
jgi:hypothetical protein